MKHTLLRNSILILLAITSQSCLYIITRSNLKPTHVEKANHGTKYDYVTTYAIDRIKEGNIGDHPIVVIDARPYHLNYYVEKHVALNKSEIVNIDYLPKNSDSAIKIYGEEAREGVILVTTSYARNSATLNKKDEQFIKETKMLFIVNGKQVDQETANKIRKDQIETIDVLKEKKSVRVYTDEEYDGVILITLKE